MKYQNKKSLGFKLAISTIAVVLITMTIAAFYNIRSFSIKTQRELKKTLTSQAIASDIILKNHIDKIKQISKNIASDTALTFSLQMNLKSQIKKFLQNTAINNPSIDEFMILDSKNQIYKTSSKKQNYFLDTLLNKVKTENISISGFWSDNGIKIVVATPIKLKNGSILGTIILIQNIYRQQDNILEMSKDIETNFMVFDHSKLIIFSDSKGILKDSNKINFSKYLDNFSDNKFIYRNQREKIGDKYYYILYKPIKNIIGKNIGYFAVAKESQELNKAINAIIKSMTLISIFSCILGSILIIMLTNVFLKPLKIFISTVQEISDGNYSKRVKSIHDDELGVLAYYFNNMIAKLENNIVEIEQKNKRLKELDKIKDDFLANTSHELRTPLNGIIGLSEALLEGVGGSISTKTKFNLNMITSSARRLVNLVNDILDFAKIRNKDLEISLKDVDIYQVVQVVTTLSKTLIGTRNIEIINKIPKNFPIIYGDDSRIEQILYNLLGNAIKFTESGTITISASINAERDSAEFRITDTGIGIPKEQLNKIFESFEQGDRSISRRYGGTGLGLSITKQLIELQGGEIYVKSTEGKGSTFVFTLPISDEVDQDRMFEEEVIREQVKREKELKEKIKAEEEKHLSRDLLPEFTPDPSKKNILIVDDEYINLQVLIDQLLLKKYNVDVAMSGQEALEKIEINQYDMLILDVMMPKMSGYEVCQKIRENHSLFNLPVLMLTAKNRSEDMVLGFEAGANDYITKPFEKKELFARINTLLGLKHAVDVSLKSTYEYLNQKQRSESLEALQKITNNFNSDLNTQKILLKLRSSIKEISNYNSFKQLIKRNGKYYTHDMEKEMLSENPPLKNLIDIKGNPYIEFIEKEKTFRLFKNVDKDLFMKPLNTSKNILVVPFNYRNEILSILSLELINELNDEDIKFIYAIVSQSTISLQNAKLLIRIADEMTKVENAMEELKRTQDQLVLSEKMAVLGGLVAGVAHEINTPVGVGVTAASTLEESTRYLKDKYNNSKMTRTDLESYLSDADTSSKLILTNLNRASDLIRSFKQISVDQSTEEKRKFNVLSYMNEVLTSLHPKLKRTSHKINLNCDKDLEIISYPGHLSQIMTNFIMNSLIHGFENKDDGEINISIEKINEELKFIYKDNGKGMTDEQRKKIFDPFFTTKRDQGGSGLGMHIVYNIVTQRLKGKIECISSLDNGIEFIINFPLD